MKQISQKLIKVGKENLLTIVLLSILGLANTFQLFQNTFSLNDAEATALSILLIAALLWIDETIPLYITGLGILLMQQLWLMPYLKQASVSVSKEDFYLAFFGDITLLFMGGFVLSALLNKYGLARMLAKWMLRKTGTSPSRILLGIILVSSILSMWMSNTATAAMMFAIVGPLILQLPETSKFSKALAIAIPFACNLGGLGTPIGTPPNAIAIEYLQQNNINVTFITWMMISIPLVAILLFLLWKILLKVFPAGDVKFTLETEEFSEFSPRQYAVMVIFGLTIIGWVTSEITGLSPGTVGLMVVIASFGLQLLQIPDFRNISWDILFMLGGGLCLGVGLNKSGLTETIAAAIPLESSFWFAFVLIVILAALMTTFMSNTATANLLIPVAVSLPQNELLLVLAISIMCSSSMALPVSTPPNAIAFGSGLLKSKDMISVGIMITILALLIVGIASIAYFPLFF